MRDLEDYRISWGTKNLVLKMGKKTSEGMPEAI